MHTFNLSSRAWSELNVKSTPSLAASATYARVRNVLYAFQAAGDDSKAGCRLYSFDMESLSSWQQLLPSLHSDSEVDVALKEAVAELSYNLTEKMKSSFLSSVGDDLLFIESDKMIRWNPFSAALVTQPLRGARPPIQHCSVTVVGETIFTFGGWSNREQLNDTYALNSRTGVWYKPHQQGTVPQRRNYHLSGVVNLSRPLTIQEDDLVDDGPASKTSAQNHPDDPDEGVPNAQDSMEVDSGDSGAQMRSGNTDAPSLEFARSESAFAEGDAAASRVYPYVFVFGGWNGVNVIDDLDVLAIDSVDDGSQKSLGAFAGSEDLSDIDIIVNADKSRPIRAHKVVLASRASVLRAKLDEDPNSSVLWLTGSWDLTRALVRIFYHKCCCILWLHDSAGRRTDTYSFPGRILVL